MRFIALIIFGIMSLRNSRALAQVNPVADLQNAWVTVWQGVRTLRNQHSEAPMVPARQSQDLIGTWELEGIECESTGRAAVQIYNGHSPLFHNQLVIEKDRIQMKLWTISHAYLQTESYIVTGSTLHTHLINIYPPLSGGGQNSNLDSDTTFALAGNTLILIDFAHVSRLCPRLDHDEMYYSRAK